MIEPSLHTDIGSQIESKRIISNIAFHNLPFHSPSLVVLGLKDSPQELQHRKTYIEFTSAVARWLAKNYYNTNISVNIERNWANSSTEMVYHMPLVDWGLHIHQPRPGKQQRTFIRNIWLNRTLSELSLFQWHMMLSIFHDKIAYTAMTLYHLKACSSFSL